ncbi:hypothetical protein O181_025223 [Austropuccinia psidii MF-1]|uniref:Uncharacterized protein n=1 Tax=Austropuccinia psidii MF-1 TaxID=1389203 RepID=A0A9Q3CKB0_9BASI|nr:hypothetical protein [Austropuccinia psidii MF-1]
MDFNLSFYIFIFYCISNIPIKNSPPTKETISQARYQAVITPTPTAPLYGTTAVPQLRAHLGRGPNMELAALSMKTTFKVTDKYGEEDGENSVEEEGFDGTEVVPDPVGESEVTEGKNLSQSNQPLSHQSEPYVLAIMHQMNKIMANIQESSSSEY